ncbi:MAG: acetate kinase, partial [Bacteroidales bacterium]
MKILVLNCGSSSVKYKLINTQSTETLAEGAIEKIGLDGANLKFKLADGSKKVITSDIPDHNVAIKNILHILIDETDGCIANFNEINAVGHRLVHGGEKFNSSVLITPEVIAKVKECYPLAPLHNPVNIAGVEAIEQILPGVQQVGVFDTAFHQTMPAKAYMYALPYNFYTEFGVRKYGFHGTSHRYVSRRSCEFLGLDFESQKIITCHIGNGGSIAAIANGVSIDTSMGLTPVDGIIMGTRSGSIDPGIFTFLMERNGLTATDVQNIINKESGVKGISGISSDMRDIDAAIAKGDERAILAEDMYIYSITKYIGS